MSEPPLSLTYSTDTDVKHVLGRVGNKLPTYIDVGTFRQAANANLADRLGHVYTTKVPTFTGPGLQVVRWAEAKLAAADILDILAADLADDVREVPERLRASVAESLLGGVVGFPPGVAVDDDGAPVVPVFPATPGISHRTPGALFPNPYVPDEVPAWVWGY